MKETDKLYITISYGGTNGATGSTKGATSGSSSVPNGQNNSGISIGNNSNSIDTKFSNTTSNLIKSFNGGDDSTDWSILALYSQHEMLHLIQNTAVKSLNSSLGMVGNITGDYFLQLKIQDGLSNISKIGNIGMGAIAGLMATGGNPVGMLVGAGISIVGNTVSWGFDRANFVTDMQKQNYEIEQLRNRSGLNTLKDESRGTEE